MKEFNFYWKFCVFGFWLNDCFVFFLIICAWFNSSLKMAENTSSLCICVRTYVCHNASFIMASTSVNWNIDWSLRMSSPQQTKLSITKGGQCHNSCPGFSIQWHWSPCCLEMLTKGTRLNAYILSYISTYIHTSFFFSSFFRGFVGVSLRQASWLIGSKKKFAF